MPISSLDAIARVELLLRLTVKAMRIPDLLQKKLKFRIYPKALRTQILRLLVPKDHTTYYIRALGHFEPWG